MNRKKFLQSLGVASVGITTLPLTCVEAAPKRNSHMPPPVCVLIPSETAGPFPLDLTENSFFFRQDVRETQEGVQLNLKLKIIGLDNCEPMQNLRVNIWHCSRDGYYSGYSGNNNPGQAGLTYLRGYQFTDANGEVEFITAFPGWYNGRICHIHFQVYVSTSYAAVSQLTFPITEKNALYSDHADIYTKGEDPLNFDQDNIFSDGHDYQLATLEPNAATGAYSSYMEVAIQGSGTPVGLGHLEKETAKVFEMGQNFPNPYAESTTIPFTLKQAAEVKLEIWDLSGKKIATLMEGHKGVGTYAFEFHPKKHGLAIGNYVYQLEAQNENGIFRLPKMMTCMK